MKLLVGNSPEFIQKAQGNPLDLDLDGLDRESYQSFGFEYINEVEVVGEHQLIEMRLSNNIHK
ncbi:MAG: hypothetical protein ACI808_000443 [Paraglaciecola sp.]|jgi:hypothetical protein